MRTLAYKLHKAGKRTILSIYSVYDDGGPYCLSWDRVLVKDIPRVKKELSIRNISPLEG